MNIEYEAWAKEIYDEALECGYTSPSITVLENTFELLGKLSKISDGPYITYPDHDGSIVIDTRNHSGGIVTVFVEEKGEALCIIARGYSDHFRCSLDELPNEKLIEWITYIHDDKQK